MSPPLTPPLLSPSSCCPSSCDEHDDEPHECNDNDHKVKRSHSKHSVKGAWSAEEDALLIEAVGRCKAQYGEHAARHWSDISLAIPGRKGKQCRERYLNHLDPHLNKSPWTPEEDTILTTKHRLIGNRWSEISKFLPGRAENAVKNRFHLIFKHHAPPSPILEDEPELPRKRQRRFFASSPDTVEPLVQNDDSIDDSQLCPSLFPLSTLASHLCMATKALIVKGDFLVGSLDVKLVFDQAGVAHLERLEAPVYFLTPRELLPSP